MDGPNEHGEAFRQAHVGHLGRDERRVMAAIPRAAQPPSAAMSSNAMTCDMTRIAYNSCRNRRCRKCQRSARVQWLADRQAELLPVFYFHVVFTRPAPAGAMPSQNKPGGLIFLAARFRRGDRIR